MGARSLILIALASCGGGAPATTGTSPTGGPSSGESLRDRVVADFERAVTQSKDEYVSLFDFVAVGEYEILLHRYDLLGRLKNLTDAQKTQFFSEDGTPYPEARERRNVGNFYKPLAQRTVGAGGCKAREPRTAYAKLLGTFEALPEITEVEIAGAKKSAPTPKGYQILRDHAVGWLAKGGVVGFSCTGGTGGLTVVYTEKPSGRGYALITIYDD
ncbi:MAG: hypothetical protein H0V17_17520 [Deltaproteobacteria bacterium]|nr:hypothetical protein [Deltaproteobacteria bacterium]